MSLSLAGDGTLTGVDPALSGFGKTLQVVQTVKTDTFTTTSTSFTDITGLTVTITPTSATSKVLLTTTLGVGDTSVAGSALQLRFAGGNAGAFVGDASGSATRAWYSNISNDQYRIDTVSVTYLDSPATISPVTYSVQIRSDQGGTAYINQQRTTIGNSRDGRLPAQITAIEVAA